MSAVESSLRVVEWWARRVRYWRMLGNHHEAYLALVEMEGAAERARSAGWLADGGSQ